MTNKSLFVLKWDYIDSSDHYFFIGPENATQKDFQTACMALIDDATEVALVKARDEEDYIGWSGIVRSMVLLLAKHEYYQFVPNMMTFTGSPILDEGDLQDEPLINAGLKKRVLEYNKSVDDKYIVKTSNEDNDEIENAADGGHDGLEIIEGDEEE